MLIVWPVVIDFFIDQVKQMSKKDERIKITNEVLNGIKVI